MLKTTLAALSISFALTASAFAGRYNAVPVDLTRDFRDQEINMINDDIVGQYYTDVIVADPANAEFFVSIAPTGAWNDRKAKGSCRVAGFIKRANSILIRVQANVEYDDGSACLLTIRYQNGRQARVRLYKTGT